jgi:hypothetical protein
MNFDNRSKHGPTPLQERTSGLHGRNTKESKYLIAITFFLNAPHKVPSLDKISQHTSKVEKVK